MSSYNIVIEEAPKELVLSQLDALVANKQVDQHTIAGMKAIVQSMQETHVSIAFSGSDQKSGYVYASWHAHSDIRDVPDDELKHIPNEEGYAKDEHGVIISGPHPEWKGMRDQAFMKKYGRAPNW